LSLRAGLNAFVRPDDSAPELPEGYVEALDAFRFDNAIGVLWESVSCLNRSIDAVKPWNLLKSGAVAEARDHLQVWLRELHRFAYWVAPFLPSTSVRIREALARPEAVADHPLFPRLG